MKISMYSHWLCFIDTLTHDTDIDILSLKGDFGITIAHEMAMRGYKFPTHSKALFFSTENNVTVAHVMASFGAIFDVDDPVTSMQTVDGWSVAHRMALKGHQFSLKEIDLLTLASNDGTTVAHCMAKAGYVFPSDSALLDIKDNEGVTVRSTMSKGMLMELRPLKISRQYGHDTNVKVA